METLARFILFKVIFFFVTHWEGAMINSDNTVVIVFGILPSKDSEDKIMIFDYETLRLECTVDKEMVISYYDDGKPYINDKLVYGGEIK